jgi:hypothetical protein
MVSVTPARRRRRVLIRDPILTLTLTLQLQLQLQGAIGPDVGHRGRLKVK